MWQSGRKTCRAELNGERDWWRRNRSAGSGSGSGSSRQQCSILVMLAYAYSYAIMTVILLRSSQMSCRWACSAVAGPLKIRYSGRYLVPLRKKGTRGEFALFVCFPSSTTSQATIPCRPYLQEHDLSARQRQKQKTDMGDHLLLNPMTLVVWPRARRLRREAVNLQVDCQ
jgi:hypothetical protein